MTAGMFLDYANGTGPTDPELPCLQASVEQTSRPHSLGTINAGQGIRCGVQISSQSVQNNRAGFSAVRSLGILCRTRSPTTRLTASRRRQQCGEDAVACGLPLNDIPLILSSAGYIAGRADFRKNLPRAHPPCLLIHYASHALPTFSSCGSDSPGTASAPCLWIWFSRDDTSAGVEEVARGRVKLTVANTK